MKIKCTMLDAEDFDLTYGKVYEVEKVLDGMYKIKDDVGESSYMKEGEFEEVGEETSEWSGEGSPRVGQHCKVYVSNADHWADAEVLAVDHNIIVVRYKTPSGSYKYSGFNIRDVRPIKSEKDKEIDNMVEVMIDHFENPKGGEKFKMLAESFYNAGYRKTK